MYNPDNLCSIVEKWYWKLVYENESMDEVDMNGSESGQELTGNKTD